MELTLKELEKKESLYTFIKHKCRFLELAKKDNTDPLTLQERYEISNLHTSIEMIAIQFNFDICDRIWEEYKHRTDGIFDSETIIKIVNKNTK